MPTNVVVAIPPSSDNTAGSGSSSTTQTTPKQPEVGTTTPSSPSIKTIGGDNNNGNILGIALGATFACLAAFLIAGFAYRHKKRRDDSGRDPDYIGDVHVEQDENNRPTVTVGMWAAGMMRGNNNKAAAAAAAPPAVEVKEIDRVLADLHNSDDSSFVSTSSNADTSCYSGYSGMTGISDLNYQPDNNNNNNNKNEGGAVPTTKKSSSLEKVEELKPSISFLDNSRTGSYGSYLNVGSASQSMRREESFESDYRDKSAMATLNLKKDMLDVDVGSEDDKARTISAQKNTEMLAQQREVEKASIKAKKMKTKRVKSVSPPARKESGGGGGGGGGGSIREGIRSLSPTRRTREEQVVLPDESRDRLLPSPVEKSDDLEIV